MGSTGASTTGSPARSPRPGCAGCRSSTTRAGWARARLDLLHSPPADPARYAAFAGALAHRYGPGGSFWAAHPALPRRPVRTYEIWNEPDSPAVLEPGAGSRPRTRGSTPPPAPRSTPSIRRAVVLVGGLTRPVSFLPALLAADPALRGAIDGVAIHPYAQHDRGRAGPREPGAHRAARPGARVGAAVPHRVRLGDEPARRSRHYVPAGCAAGARAGHGRRARSHRLRRRAGRSSTPGSPRGEIRPMRGLVRARAAGRAGRAPTLTRSRRASGRPGRRARSSRLPRSISAVQRFLERGVRQAGGALPGPRAPPARARRR